MKYWYQVANSKKYKPENLEKKCIKTDFSQTQRFFPANLIIAVQCHLHWTSHVYTKKEITYLIGSLHIPGET